MRIFSWQIYQILQIFENSQNFAKTRIFVHLFQFFETKNSFPVIFFLIFSSGEKLNFSFQKDYSSWGKKNPLEARGILLRQETRLTKLVKKEIIIFFWQLFNHIYSILDRKNLFGLGLDTFLVSFVWKFFDK